MTSSAAKVNINVQNRYDRVIVLIDMDCFYCQVEEKLNPDLVGKPIAVVQYNAWRGGGIIAVNYPARAKGVTRHMRGEEAQEHCPEINLVPVPSVREKADLTKYREAGKKVADVLQTFTPLLERASVDEAYLDITEQVKVRLKEMNDGEYRILPKSLESTFCVGYETIGLFIHEISSKQCDIESTLSEFNDGELISIDTSLAQKYNLNLLVGSSIVSEIRAKVKEKTGYECSGGIAHNKILAKLACGINKPNKQTILSINETPKLLQNLPIHKIKGLGGKFGEEIMEEFQIKFIGDLLKFSKTELQKRYDEKNGYWLFLIARGIDLEAVTPRFYSKSIGCCKKFPGRNAITGINTLTHWLQQLAIEISDRLSKDIVENNRKAKQMIVNFIQEINSNEISISRSGSLISYNADVIAKSALEILQKNTSQFFKQESTKCLNNPIKYLGISVGKFETISSGQSTLQEMFSKQKRVVEEKRLEKDVCKEIPNNINNNNIEVHSINVDSQCGIVQKNFNKSNIESNGFDISANTIHNFDKTYNALNDDTSINIEVNNKLPAGFDIESDSQFQKHIPSKNNENAQINNYASTSAESTNLNYTKTYVEYTLIPQSEESFTKCDECGCKVLSINIQTHLDGHLAFKLSQQLREEYRNELKSKFSQSLVSNSCTNKKPNQLTNSAISKSNSSKKKKQTATSGNITKYLKICEKSTTNDGKNLVKCSECNCFVDELKIFEHKDLHLAQQIQQEWNQC